MRIGILTAGGDCPGLNAVIRAVTRSAIAHEDEVLGFTAGYRGVAKQEYRELDMRSVSGILHLGGTILYTSSYNPYREENGIELVKKSFKELELDALVAAGGEHTMKMTGDLYLDHGLPVIGVPKTIDNDVPNTDYTFGFDTAFQVATFSIDRLHTTAQSHNRVMVVEVMGRNTGWIAVMSGIAGGADAILIPEVDTTVEEISDSIKKRHERGKNFSIVVVAEGANLSFKSGEKRQRKASEEPDGYGYPRLGGIGQALGRELEDRTGFETRVTTLGHVQRGGTPTATDRVLATRYGVKATEMARAGEFGRMASLKGSQMTTVPLEDVDGFKKVDLSYLEMAKYFFG